MSRELTGIRHNQILLDLALGVPPEVVAEQYDMNVGSIYRLANDEENKAVIRDYQEKVEQAKIARAADRIGKLRDKIEEKIETILDEKLRCVSQDESWATKDKAATDLLKMYGLGAVEPEEQEHKTPQCVVVVGTAVSK